MSGPRWWVYAGIAAAGVAVDQWVKWLVETRLPMHELIDMLPFLALYRTYNTGVAFSMFSSVGGLGLVLISLAVIAFVIWLAVRSGRDQVIARLGFALIVSGAIGNVIDRAIFGHVIDYIFFHTPAWSFAVFNLADAFISVGAAAVLLQEVLGSRKAPPDGPPEH